MSFAQQMSLGSSPRGLDSKVYPGRGNGVPSVDLVFFLTAIGPRWEPGSRVKRLVFSRDVPADPCIVEPRWAAGPSSAINPSSTWPVLIPLLWNQNCSRPSPVHRGGYTSTMNLLYPSFLAIASNLASQRHPTRNTSMCAAFRIPRNGIASSAALVWAWVTLGFSVKFIPIQYLFKPYQPRVNLPHKGMSWTSDSRASRVLLRLLQVPLRILQRPFSAAMTKVNI